MPMKFRDLISLLEKDGWFVVRTNGSHRIYSIRGSRAAFRCQFMLWAEMCQGP
jgi:predicted RNA binding protein YcfA (HicA-like mRNA interferase family)